MRDMKEISKQIDSLKGLRKAARMSQREISENFGIPLRTWEEWEAGRRKMPEYLLRLITYKVRIDQMMERKDTGQDHYCGHKLNIIQDEKKNNIVVVNDIRFIGRQNIKWEDVEKFLKEYVGENYEIIETSDKVFIGTDFPEELKGSEDTKRLKGANAKAKANATSEMPLLLQYATNRRWQENFKTKHGVDAKYGWYRFTSRFALPVYSPKGDLERYNIFRIEMLIRHASDDKLYLYDMVNVKKEKETGTPPRQ